VVCHGYNYRLDELRAALGRAQLRKLANNNRRRGELVAAYRRHLAAPPGWVVPFADWRGDSAFHLMTAVAPDQQTRVRVAQSLKDAGIQTSLHYPCAADFQAFAAYSGCATDASRAFASRAITLPLFPDLTVSQVEEVCARVAEAARRTE
jgi:dTDP-4-amino-4,6-dideoxygalactose transaminase